MTGWNQPARGCKYELFIWYNYFHYQLICVSGWVFGVKIVRMFPTAREDVNKLFVSSDQIPQIFDFQWYWAEESWKSWECLLEKRPHQLSVICYCCCRSFCWSTVFLPALNQQEYVGHLQYKAGWQILFVCFYYYFFLYHLPHWHEPSITNLLCKYYLLKS